MRQAGLGEFQEKHDWPRVSQQAIHREVGNSTQVCTLEPPALNQYTLLALSKEVWQESHPQPPKIEYGFAPI